MLQRTGLGISELKEDELKLKSPALRRVDWYRHYDKH
jgi:hypothetical protein